MCAVTSIRYILFIIDKFAGATHLIDEMTFAPKHPEMMSSEDLGTSLEDLNTNEELQMKEYIGTDIPVFDMNSFGDAFDMAVKQYGSSKTQFFWWQGNVYTTEIK